MLRKRIFVLAAGLALLALGLSGCFPVITGTGDEPPPPVEPIRLTGIHVELVVMPPFWNPAAFPPDHYPEGETLRCTVGWEDLAPDDDISVSRVNWIIWRTKPDDGWRFVPGGRDGGAVLGEHGEIMLTSDAKPLVGCGCRARCPDGPEIWDYEIVAFVELTTGQVLEARKTIHIVPLAYYWGG